MKNLILFAVSLFLFGCQSIAAAPEPTSAMTAAVPTTTFVPAIARATAPPARIPTGLMSRYQIDQEKHPDAVCNDGTTPVFYFRPGTGDGTNRWLIWFQGGGSCYDGPSCSDRRLRLTSNEPWMADENLIINGQNEQSGVIDTNSERNPDFHNWNHVLLIYCSSDLWSGTRQAGPELNNIYFKGHYIVNAFMAALQDPSLIGYPTVAEASDILFTGSSAGAYGLIYNIDRLREQFPLAVVKGVMDSALYPAELSEEDAAEDEFLWDVWQPVLDQSCVATRATPSQCMINMVLLDNYISTPIFIQQDLRDQTLLAGFNPDRSFELNCVFVSRIRRFLTGRDGVFSPSRGFHTFITSSRFNSTTIHGYTMADVLGNWYFERGQPTALIETYQPEYTNFLCN